MDKNSDEKLYNDYLNGEIDAFEKLYLKYENKIKYFIYNIVKDYEKAEDITQDVFVYIFKNKLRNDSSFKYYVFLVAKSRAIDYLNKEKRRTAISEKYMSSKEERMEADVLEGIVKQEEKLELLKSINLLSKKYRNAIYLTRIEGFSYKETAKIMNTSISNVKNLVHRGKKELRKILIKKGIGDMSKTSKFIIMIIFTTVVLSGVVYAVTKVYKHFSVTMNPSFQSTLDENTINNLWVGTLDLAWKELAEKVGGKIELKENVEIANDLNQSTFSKEMLSEDDYEINISRTDTGGYDINASLNKDLNFLKPFDNFADYYNRTFGTNGTEYIKYFGINNGSSEELNKNVEVLFYNMTNNSSIYNDFAVKLKTKEGDEIILYRTDDKKSFDEYYEDIEVKTANYTGKSEFQEGDEILVPFVKLEGMISYDELFRKTIKNTDGMYIANVVQNVKFSLTEKGCNLSSEATAVTEYMSIGDRYFYFEDTFIIFMKEKDIAQPYFALKVDSSDVLEKK